MFRRNCSSIIHRFRDNEVFLHTENDVINISPLGGAVYSFQQRNLIGLLCVLSVFNSNFTSITHRFRDKDVFLQTGSDVMVLYPLEGAVRSS